MTDFRPRRVLMTGDTVGGVWTFTLELAEALAAYGIEVVLAAMGGKATAAQVKDATRITNLRLFTSDYKLEWMDDPWNDVAASARWLQELEAWFTPDVVHLNTYGHGSVSWRAPVVLSAHSCVLSWWKAVKTEPVPQRWNRYRQAVKQSMRLAQVLVAPSRAMLQAAETHYSSSLPPDRRVIPNGRDARKFSTGDKAPFILCAGRLWDEAKNIAAVVEIAPRLPWPVHLAGEASGPNGTGLGVHGCSVLGRLGPSALAEWLSRAAIYVMPARYEPFGYSALEAALSGCPLVLGDIPSLREVWGDAAIYVDPDDRNQLADILINLIEDSSYRHDMAARAQARARCYSPRWMAEGYLDAYQTAMQSRRAACAS